MKCVYGWVGVRYVITKFSWMDRLPNFVTHQGVETSGVERSSCDARVLGTTEKIGAEFSLTKKR